MDLYDRICKAASEKGISINKLEKECGFPRSYICKFRKITPGIDKIQAIADVLGVKIEYLQTGVVPEIPDQIDPDTLEMIELFNKLNKEQRGLLIQFMRSIAL